MKPLLRLTLLRPRRDLPDGFARRGIEPAEPWRDEGKLEEVGPARRQLDGRRVGLERDGIPARGIAAALSLRGRFAEQAVVVDRQRLRERLAAVDREAERPAEPPLARCMQPVVPGRELQRRPTDPVRGSSPRRIRQGCGRSSANRRWSAPPGQAARALSAASRPRRARSRTGWRRRSRPRVGTSGGSPSSRNRT